MGASYSHRRALNAAPLSAGTARGRGGDPARAPSQSRPGEPLPASGTRTRTGRPFSHLLLSGGRRPRASRPQVALSLYCVQEQPAGQLQPQRPLHLIKPEAGRGGGRGSGLTGGASPAGTARTAPAAPRVRRGSARFRVASESHPILKATAGYARRCQVTRGRRLAAA